jgi:hypothetical protein
MGSRARRFRRSCAATGVLFSTGPKSVAATKTINKGARSHNALFNLVGWSIVSLCVDGISESSPAAKRFEGRYARWELLQGGSGKQSPTRDQSLVGVICPL